MSRHPTSPTQTNNSHSVTAGVLGMGLAAVALFRGTLQGLTRRSPASSTTTKTLSQAPVVNSNPRPARDSRPWYQPQALWGLLREAASEWSEDKAPRLGAALAYYCAFSLAPFLVIVVAIAGLVLGAEAAQGRLTAEIRNMVGEQGGQAVETMLAHANRPAEGGVAAVLGVVMLLFGAAGLFGQLQDALNTVWEVEPKPGRGIWGIIRDRFFSLTMVLGTAFLLLVSLVVSAALSAVTSRLGTWDQTVWGHVLNFVVSLGVVTLLFAMIYRYLPDAKIAWRDVWLGATLTAAFFTLGKFLIGLYLGYSGTASTYGAAGSLAVLLIWLYYSAQIFLFGAELTKVYADRFGSRIVPTENAQPVKEEQREEQGIPHSRS